MDDDNFNAPIKDFRQLWQVLAESEAGMKSLVYPKLNLGDVWWIPDEVTGFDRERHPWVIVKGYVAHRPYVEACPRTTSSNNSKRGIVTPPGILADLDREGLILLDHRRRLIVKRFIDFEYIGRLSQHWLDEIVAFQESLMIGKKKA